jgi:hypothetical protein
VAFVAFEYPLVNVYITMERSTIFNGKTHYKWQFSIAMLNYQRVRPDPEFGGAMFAMFLDKPGLSGLSS